MSDFPHVVHVTFYDGRRETYHVSVAVARELMSERIREAVARPAVVCFLHARGWTLLRSRDVRTVDISNPPSDHAARGILVQELPAPDGASSSQPAPGSEAPADSVHDRAGEHRANIRAVARDIGRHLGLRGYGDYR